MEMDELDEERFELWTNGWRDRYDRECTDRSLHFDGNQTYAIRLAQFYAGRSGDFYGPIDGGVSMYYDIWHKFMSALWRFLLTNMVCLRTGYRIHRAARAFDEAHYEPLVTRRGNKDRYMGWVITELCVPMMCDALKDEGVWEKFVHIHENELEN